MVADLVRKRNSGRDFQKLPWGSKACPEVGVLFFIYLTPINRK